MAVYRTGGRGRVRVVGGKAQAAAPQGKAKLLTDAPRGPVVPRDVAKVVGGLSGRQLMVEIGRREGVGTSNAYAMALCYWELARPERYKTELGYRSFAELLKQNGLASRVSTAKWFAVVGTYSEREVLKLGGFERSYLLIRAVARSEPGGDPRRVLEPGAKILGQPVEQVSGRWLRGAVKTIGVMGARDTKARPETRKAAGRMRRVFTRLKISAVIRAGVHKGTSQVATYLETHSALELLSVLKQAVELDVKPA